MMMNLRAQEANLQLILKIFSNEVESKVTDANLL